MSHQRWCNALHSCRGDDEACDCGYIAEVRQQRMTGTVEALRSENAALATALHDLLGAMRLWGSWGDGVPEDEPGEGGAVGRAYDRAKALLDAKETSVEPVK